ncbi:MAG: hypothetical protein IKI75_05680 [Lachnospiraceae bacterium]|nr:hypothetical protein [Lachnospiraceae bacterium]
MITNGRIIPEEFKENGIDKDYDEVFELICQNVKIPNYDGRFVHFIDENYVMDTTKGYRYENITPAYDKVINYGLSELKYDSTDSKFKESYNRVCDNLIMLAGRIVDELRVKDKSDRRIEWFENLADKPAIHFEESIQRMLFLNQIMWQTDHRLVGLGAWDSFLFEAYQKDMDSGILDRDEAVKIVEDLFRVLHYQYTFKSNVLMGDTGQIFVLGKSDENGNYICNDLTYIFIEALKNVNQPDPKCLLRINKNTPDDLIRLSLETIATGIGAPLLANDDVIIPALLDFGIDKTDACNYATSACWEPLIGGKSSSNNNRTVLNYCKALDNLLKRADLSRICNFDDLVTEYIKHLRLNLCAVKRVIQQHRFPYDPLLSVFMYGCYESEKDVSWGGACYCNTGITSVGMGNLVDSLYNIKRLVFEEKKYSLYDVKRIIITNYENENELARHLKGTPSCYGKDNPETVALVKRITTVVSEEIADFNTYLGEKMKVGLSGAAYLDAGKAFGATFDGRYAGEPFVVHISNEDNNGYTEIVNFASQMKYDKGLFNGNVLDFMVSPDFIAGNIDKFVSFIKAATLSGFFEMQMNVVSADQMIEARKNPEAFPNLIVRVWGFSSYFNDLPDEYKDVLIERALKNERRTA